jgi:hypothetical protein
MLCALVCGAAKRERSESRHSPLDCSIANSTLSQGFDPVGYPTAPLASYQTNDNYLDGTLPALVIPHRRGALRKSGPNPRLMPNHQ